MLRSIKFTVETGWPIDRAHTQDDLDIDGIDWCQQITLDVLPRRGDMVDIGGDFLEVLHVYITPNAAAEYSAIECHVEPGPLGVITDMGMAAAGWKEE